ncbi:hypothetical protein [Ralstonia insidiosa]|uniref:hypothetical protein n=1 Tax=Ralstonia insidiosa TaxID=190721 RepID=UPI001FCA3028|nr:hypothetical protein [Ralstonia insidiosa]
MFMLKNFVLAALLYGVFFACKVASAQPQKPPEPALMVHFDYYPKDHPLIRALEQRLQKAIQRAGAGELGETELHLDGNEGYLYIYGPDPDRLYGVVKPILKSSTLMTEAEITKRHGNRKDTFVMRRDGVQ